MTDNDIIKKLTHCINNDCSTCPCDAMNCNVKIRMALALDLINRQKAEIERLIDLINEIGEYNEAWVADNHDLRVELKRADEEIERKDRILESYALQYGTVVDKDVILRNAKAEAIREFAERLHKNARTFCEYDKEGWNCVTFAVEIDDIDNLVKEMTEETK